jgi:hypothetical protein
MNKKIVKKVIVAVVLVSVAFYGGMKYGESKIPQGKGLFAQGGMQGGRFRGSANGGGATGGEVLSKDATGLTLKLRNGGSQVILVGSSTQVQKSVAGGQDDVTVGSNVMVVGTQNTDGSFTANMIQIRAGQ